MTLIRREDLLDEIGKSLNSIQGDGFTAAGAKIAFMRAITAIKDTPSFAPDDPRAHGAWITQNSGYTKFQCSVCGSKNHDICWPFCCKCGAKMDLPLVAFSEKAEREEGGNETD